MTGSAHSAGAAGVVLDEFSYDDAIVRKFLFATLIWGTIGMLVGLLIALQLANPAFNLGLPITSFGRLRPLHTNAVIFAFAGNAFFTGCYYSTQRLLKARMFSDALSKLHFWGWQLIILLGAITLPLGFTQAKEYAELEWPIDILITIVWVIFAANFIGTLMRRRERHLYVAIWFYIASIVTVAILHIFNNLAIPAGPLKSYSIYAGVQDAFMQWWYGHNAVAFFLTTPFLGLMYYFMPKAAEGPVFSYRLSILHFWSLVFLYIWAGPHHLHYTALPEWASTLGMIFSVMLWAPSWGGMINGLLTLRGGWQKVVDDPILKFFVVGITAYGMSTFEGPMLSIKSVNALAHYTDWIIAHVHTGALGWNGFMTFGMVYWLLPRLFQAPLHSKKLASLHFWIATFGIILYVVAIYSAGVTQGLMWRAFDETGRLTYPDFVETVARLMPMYWTRAVGGGLYIVGMFLFGYNILMTWRKRPARYDVPVVRAPALAKRHADRQAGEARRRGPARRRRGDALSPGVGADAAGVHHAGDGGGGGRLALRGAADVPDQVERPDDRLGQAVHAARALRSRHLHPRGMLQLSLADDPAAALRDRALRRVLQAGRVGVRPPVPLGLATDRAGPGARGGQVSQPLARAPLRQSAGDRGEVDHAGLSPVRDDHDPLAQDCQAGRRDGDARGSLR